MSALSKPTYEAQCIFMYFPLNSTFSCDLFSQDVRSTRRKYFNWICTYIIVDPIHYINTMLYSCVFSTALSSSGIWLSLFFHLLEHSYSLWFGTSSWVGSLGELQLSPPASQSLTQSRSVAANPLHSISAAMIHLSQPICCHARLKLLCSCLMSILGYMLNSYSWNLF